MAGEYLEVYTYQNLLKKALDSVPDDIDKTQGSIIYDALAPACYQIAEMYMNLKEVILNTSVFTAYGEYLDNRVIEQGLVRKEATKAIKKGIFTFNENTPQILQIGSRFATVGNNESLVYKAIEKLQEGEYLLECESYGTVGNGYIGDLIPISNINNLKSATITTLVTPASDIETDDELRERFILSVKQKAFGGNIAQYDEEIRSIEGVGEVQVYPTWDGGGTVKCSIVDTEYNPISQDFINVIQELIDPQESGIGQGLAPIGHRVTIATPEAISININAEIEVLNGYTSEQLEGDISNSIEEYLITLKKSWGISDDLNRYSLTIYVSQVMAAILKVFGVANVSNVRINGSVQDLILNQNALQQQIPMLGEVVVN